MNNGMLNTAENAARVAGKIIIKNFEKGVLTVDEKQKNDLVSNVDRECEQAIREFILNKYPTHGFLGEEGGIIKARKAAEDDAKKVKRRVRPDNNEYLWIVDPIDGTTNFVRGIPHVAVSIALKINGRTELGVVYDPIRDEMFKALRGQGCELNDHRLRVAEAPRLDGTIIATSFPHRKRHLVPYYTDVLLRVFNDCADIRRAGTASLDLAYVAAGRLDGYFEMGLNSWDFAAGELMVREAGGMVTDFDGDNKYTESGNIICGNSKIIRQIVSHAKVAKEGANTSDK
ncbi:MAG: inositol monophosphatase family protein [Succinivibrionaceae bacterium]